MVEGIVLLHLQGVTHQEEEEEVERSLCHQEQAMIGYSIHYLDNYMHHQPHGLAAPVGAVTVGQPDCAVQSSAAENAAAVGKLADVSAAVTGVSSCLLSLMVSFWVFPTQGHFQWLVQKRKRYEARMEVRPACGKQRKWDILPSPEHRFPQEIWTMGLAPPRPGEI